MKSVFEYVCSLQSYKMTPIKYRKNQWSVFVAQLASLWKLLSTFGSMLVNMAGPQTPNIDPKLPKQ